MRQSRWFLVGVIKLAWAWAWKASIQYSSNYSSCTCCDPYFKKKCQIWSFWVFFFKITAQSDFWLRRITTRTRRTTGILIIIEGQFQVFQRVFSSRLVLKAVESCFVALTYYENGSTGIQKHLHSITPKKRSVESRFAAFNYFPKSLSNTTSLY